VAEEAAVERKEVRRAKPLLIELQVPEWQGLLGRLRAAAPKKKTQRVVTL
jgi:hypothetical protein